VVEHNGDVFACDFFVEPEWKLGNISENRLIDMLNSETQTRFGRQKSDISEECTDCQWLIFCRGGCTKDRIRDPQDRGVSHFCKAYKMFFEYADSRMRALAENWLYEQERKKGRINQQAAHEGHVRAGRNDPCPCGSGLKFKKCCGKR
jgi:uncharacterized protein